MSEAKPACPCGWQKPPHMAVAFPKTEALPSSVQVTMQCPVCSFWHQAIFATDPKELERAKRESEKRG